MEIKYKIICREWKWYIKLYKCLVWDFFIIKNYKLINDLKKKLMLYILYNNLRNWFWIN